MRIGFATVYSWRPHVEHIYFLATLAQKAGHEIAYLTCDADLPTCYTRELRPSRAAWLHCALCRAGGLRSYARAGITSIGEMHRAATASPESQEWSRSSAATLGRFESDADFGGAQFNDLVERLSPAAELAHQAASAWITREKLDAVCVFNGRMDATRGILEAASKAGINCVSVERTWFGDGLQLLPNENCLGLRNVDSMMAAWRDVPLTRDQALRAASHVASRFLRQNTTEWRAYNTEATHAAWPVPDAGPRILLLPGSRNEVWGHPDWASCWPEPTAAYDALIEHLGLRPADLVLRCHPNWGEKIGEATGQLSERYFGQWAERRGIHVIPSTDRASTLGLIEQADAVVVSGGSAALEAGILGKQVIAVSPSVYQRAGFQSDAYDPIGVSNVELYRDIEAPRAAQIAASIACYTLRFCYTMVYRIPQYVREVRCMSTTKYAYDKDADAERFVQLMRTGTLKPDDAERAVDQLGEDGILGLVRKGDWDSLRAPRIAVQEQNFRTVKRRWLFRPVGRLREALPRGDR